MREPKPCSIDGCERLTNVPGTARGLCHSHYRRLKVYGDPLGAAECGPQACTIDGCEARVQARGWCSKHLSRWYRYGTTDDPVFGHPDVKSCKRCGGVFPRTTAFFYLHQSQAGGLSAYCRACSRSVRRAWLEERRDEVNARRRRAYWDDPEAERERAKQWRRDNPERSREIALAGHHRRRAAKRDAASESFSPVEIFERDGWRCGICGGGISRSRQYPDPLSVSLDHIIPLARGGSHTRANTQAAHLGCNLRKHCGGTDQLRLIG